MKHGEKAGRVPNSPEYNAWKNMRRRCYDSTRREYPRYGGRGIAVCDRWQEFANFLADMGRRPGPGYSIEREKNDGNYEPGNCRWATATEQARNRHTNRLVEFNGETMPLAQACEGARINGAAVRARMHHCGWSPERALSEPVQPRHRLTEDERLSIARAGGTMQSIADAHGCSIATVWKIKHGKPVRVYPSEAACV